MAELAWLWAVWAGLVLGPGAVAEPLAPMGEDNNREILAELRPDIRAEIDRLCGHDVVVTETGYVIEDIAGEGAPVVGVVERRGPELWLVGMDGQAYRLAGLLARPRFAGPGYKIWALGPVTERGGERVLEPRRLGVLGRTVRTVPGSNRPESRSY